MTTGEMIASIRETKGVLQKDLAKAIHIDPVVLNRIEKNKRPARGDEVKAIANYFNVSTDYLLGNENINSHTFPNVDESNLLNGYRELNDDGKHLILSMISQLNFGRTASGIVSKPHNSKVSVTMR